MTGLRRAGCASAAVAVLLGALGAHALKDVLDPEALESFHTGVRYQFGHSLALLLLAALSPRVPDRVTRQVAGCFIVGTVCFSGSIYLLSTRSLFLPEGLGWLGPVTPLGGLLLIAGWVRWAFAGTRN